EEIQASLAAAASASWSATSLFNRYWPQFSVGALGRYAGTNTTSGLPGAATSFNERNLNWDGAVGVGFNWRLFDGGINAANAEAQRALARAARDQAAERRLAVSREVEQSYAAYLTSQLALESTQAQVNAARAAAVAVQERFAVGVSDMTAVVQSLNQAIEAANAYATAVRVHNSAVANLYRSSARWPAGTEPLLQQRVSQLQQR
ncbi:MAG: TolC family protein, partial [Cyanobacteriota bacterium]|nr:TolC family protein [Cyanobacteriota bacterium]